MKKFIMLSAVMAAVSTAFVACSSNDDLAQAPAVPEENVSEGTPLVINVVDATRGTDYTTSSLPGFKLFSTKNGSDDTWLTGTQYTNAGSNTFTPINPATLEPDPVNWQDEYAYDFYAVSEAMDAENFDAYTRVYYTQAEIDADAPTYYDADDEAAGTIPAGKSIGDLKTPAGPAYGKTTSDIKTDSRNFTYTVPTTYASQKDLLVGAAINKAQAAGAVSIPFYHALAQIKKVKVNFKRLKAAGKIDTNSARIFMIKSITLKNVYTTGKFTFPYAWAAPDGTAWTDYANPDEYTIELGDFQTDINGNIYIFDEIQDPTNIDENLPYQYATTVRATIGSENIPNIFAPCDDRIELPLSATDGGLYLLPQNLSTTVTENSGGTVTYTLSGPYAEIEGFVINDGITWLSTGSGDSVEEALTDAGGPDYDTAAQIIDDGFSFFKGGTGTEVVDGKVCNSTITQTLNDATKIGKYPCPISTTLLPNKGYVLNIDLSSTLNKATQGTLIFNGATIKTD